MIKITIVDIGKIDQAEERINVLNDRLFEK